MILTRRNNTASLLAVLLTALAGGLAMAQDASVFASGTWYKLAVTQQGIFQITGRDLQNQGISLSSVDPEQIQIFGHGGGMLPQALDQPRWNDPPENAIRVVGGEDGKFDAQDYILFYGQSPDQIGYQMAENVYQFTYQKNLYSDTVFYFLTFDREKGKRIGEEENIPVDTPILTAFDDYAFHETDQANILKGSGREWYGEAFNSGENLTFNFPASGLSDNTNLRLLVDVLGKSSTHAEFDVALNNQSLGKIPVEPVVEGTYNEKGKIASGAFEVNSGQVQGENLAVRLSYQSGGSNGSAYLNRILIQFNHRLQLYDNQTFFRSLQSMQYPSAAFQINTSTDQVAVWDVTDPQTPQDQKFTLQAGTLVFGTNTGSQLKEYAVFKARDFLRPEWKGKVNNQNLKEENVPDLLMVSYPGFVAEAERLAQYRQQQDQLSVKVVTTTQIYNEFSSGAQDISAIRNYLKYLYDKGQGQLKYLLLFGKCSFDYKDRIAQNTNFVPIYESRNSTHPIYSYSSDDYFGFLENGEGVWEESFAGDQTLDIGVGRLPVKSLAEAKAVVDKLMHYGSGAATFGDWRNRVVFVADDGDGDKHQQDADRLATQIDTVFSAFNNSKIYVDAYPQESLPSGERAPQVNEAIQDAIKKGALIVNYTGHGNERQWAVEKILDLDMINQWKNLDKLPFFVTATCEFGRYDDPTIVSGAERLVLNPQGGAIGMVTTTRPVFSNSNFLLNQAFYQHVFQEVNGQYPTLGEIFEKTKNEGLNGRVNRNFSLLGDPSMRLAYPKDEVVLDSVLSMSPAGDFISADTLKALAHVKFKGRVVHRRGQDTNQNFNGILYLTVYDKPVQTRTKGNEGTVMQFEERKSVIHRGKASVTNGFFELELVIPKNIDYKNGRGKISMYAVAEGQPMTDAQGASSNVQIGGSSEPLPSDEQSPSITLFMDDATFVNGGTTAANTTLIARIRDENGINISSNGLGQDIVATLEKEGEKEDPQVFVLNDFFVMDQDDYQQGTLTYPMENLAEGKYHVTLQAWDNANNKSENSVTFFVQSQDQLAVHRFYNAPNPFQGQTAFTIDHNRAGDHLKVTISIINLQGQLVYGFKKEYPHASTRITDVYWDGRNANGNYVRPGIYLAHLSLQSLTDGIQKEKVQKIIILN